MDAAAMRTIAAVLNHTAPLRPPKAPSSGSQVWTARIPFNARRLMERVTSVFCTGYIVLPLHMKLNGISETRARRTMRFIYFPQSPVWKKP